MKMRQWSQTPRLIKLPDRRKITWPFAAGSVEDRVLLSRAAASDPGLRPRREGGALLLEVVLALALFVMTAAIVSGGLNASMKSVTHLKLRMHAANLAVTLLSELELGIRPMSAGGPQPFEEPFEEWTWEINPEPTSITLDEPDPFRQVEVVVRHQSEPVVRRLVQILLVNDGTNGTESAYNSEAPGDFAPAFDAP